MIAQVISDVSLDRVFDYRVPPELEPSLRVGAAVRIPFGRSEREGYVLGLAETSELPAGKLKALNGLSERRAPIPEKLIALGEWMAQYYCCSREQSIRTLLPAAVRSVMPPIFQAGIPAILSVYFDLFSGFVQAFVFCLLTMVYIGSANPAPEEKPAEAEKT